ncbi:hypothetical protein JW930_06880 [Candidatus Woesearchaeota archaeon]|nr:hypothetical protein [Candidatus Woesearchaeota archaeon]
MKQTATKPSISNEYDKIVKDSFNRVNDIEMSADDIERFLDSREKEWLSGAEHVLEQIKLLKDELNEMRKDFMTSANYFLRQIEFFKSLGTRDDFEKLNKRVAMFSFEDKISKDEFKMIIQNILVLRK